MRKLFLLLLSTIYTEIGLTQINTEYIEPFLTDSAYVIGQDLHLVTRDASNLRDTLFLFMGGTRAKTWPYGALSEFAAGEGFATITLSYSNIVGTPNFANSRDSLIFDKYHQEICYGEEVTEAVNVDSLNCIYTRTVKLLQYLGKTYPEEKWNQYLIDSVNLDWPRIIVGGHSQGSGHAAYIAKKHEVARVIMMAGPNDYSNYFGQAANWLRTDGVTTADHYYVYLNRFDEVVRFDKQLANVEALGLCGGDLLLVDSLDTLSGSTCLYTEQATGPRYPYHGSMIVPNEINQKVWKYMLTSQATTSASEMLLSTNMKVYPNPAETCWYITMAGGPTNQTYRISNILGQQVMEGRLNGSDPYQINCSTWRNGIYVLTVGQQSIKILKQ